MNGSDYEVFHYRSARLEAVELHHHDFYEVYLLLQGSVEYIVENQIYHVRPGDVMLVSPLELHQARIGTGQDCERIVLWVDRAYLERLSTAATSLTRCFDRTAPDHSNLLRLPRAAFDTLCQRTGRLAELRGQTDYGCDVLRTACLTELMVDLNRAALRSRPVNAATSDSVVDQVVAYINDHYNEPITLDMLSERFFLSKYHLLRKFEEQVGTTVHRYVMQKRLMIARQLLAGGVPGSEACLHCGFGDYANFYRAFKAEYGLTPRQYLQSLQARDG